MCNGVLVSIRYESRSAQFTSSHLNLILQKFISLGISALLDKVHMATPKHTSCWCRTLLTVALILQLIWKSHCYLWAKFSFVWFSGSNNPLKTVSLIILMHVDNTQNTAVGLSALIASSVCMVCLVCTEGEFTVSRCQVHQREGEKCRGR